MKKNNRNKSKANRSNKKLSQQELLDILNSTKNHNHGPNRGPIPLSQIYRFGYFVRGVLQNAAASFAVADFRINVPRQPVVGGPIGPCAGWTSFSASYLGAIVQTFKVKLTVEANEPGLSLSAYLIFSDTQPSTLITTYALALTNTHSINTFAHCSVSQTTGMSRAVNKMVIVKPGQILGNPMNYHAESDYVQEQAVNPPSIIWCSVVVVSPVATTFIPNGIIFDFDATFVSKAFGLLPNA